MDSASLVSHRRIAPTSSANQMNRQSPAMAGFKRNLDGLLNQSLQCGSNDSHVRACVELFANQGGVFSDTEGESEFEEDDYFDESDEEEETRMAQALAQAVFSKSCSTPALNTLMSRVAPPPSSKKPRIDVRGTPPTSTTTTSRTGMIKESLSAPCLSSPEIVRPKTEVGINSQLDRFLRALLEKSEFGPAKYFAASSVPHFFEELTVKSMEAYDMELIRAVRESNVDALRTMSKAGRTMHAGNKFGETIAHHASRRGAVSVVRFLLLETDVKVRVCCDYGRTPLHDACWTTEPNWSLMNILLDECPDCLYITDKRGFTPLSYVPREVHGKWCNFLSQRGAARLQPIELF